MAVIDTLQVNGVSYDFKDKQAYVKPATGIPASDIAEGVIPDVSAFITKSVDDLTNYYLKSETYTKAEVQALIGAINQFKYEVYASLEAITSPANNVLYLIGPAGSGTDKYEEYVFSNSTFVKIGDTSINLSGYVTTTALNTALTNYTTTANLTMMLAAKLDKTDVVNDLTTGGTAKALSAEQGKVLEGKVSQLGQEVNEIYETKVVTDKFTFGGVSNVITFNPISIAEDGDALEFRAKTDIAASDVKGLAFVRNGAGNIAISLTSAILGIKDSTGTWIPDFNASYGAYIFATGAGAIDRTFRTFKLSRESTSLKLYIDGTLYIEVANAPTITFDRIGGAHSGNYWEGELEFFRYTHNGSTSDLLDFPGYNASGDVTVTTHNVESGLLTEKVDKIPGKGLSANDFTDEDKEELGDIANSEAMKMTGGFITLLEDQSLNDSGEQLTLPIIKQTGFARFVGVNGKIYTNAANLVKLLLKPGSVTYLGVTLTIDENFWVTITGTATDSAYICYNNLKGYGNLDTAKADITIPEMPLGTYQLGMTQRDSATTKGTIYVRAKNSASWIATLTTQGYPDATINMAEIGAMGAYLISGTTYNERFRFMVMPSIVFNSLASITEYNTTNFPTDFRLIENDGIFKYENYTIGDGPASFIEKMLPVENYATKGVTCLWFGDSISELRNLPHLVGEKLAVNVIDVSEAGSPFTKTGLSKWYDTGVESLVEQKIANNFSPAEAALSAQLADGDITQDRYTAKTANLESLENCDMSSIKKIVILAGTNDLSSSALTLADFKTGIANTLTNIFTEYQEIQVYCITPPYRTGADDVRPNGLVLSDIVGAIVEVCKSFGVPCFDFLANCGVNSVNASHWLPDGLHPSAEGDEMFSTRIANWLNSIF